MIDRKELERRVEVRKQELSTRDAALLRLQEKISSFINDIKGRSVIYNLVKNLSVWKELENMIVSDFDK